MPRKFWNGRDRNPANAPGPQAPFARLLEMAEQVRIGVADVTQARERLQQQIAILAEQAVKLDQQAVLARNAHREDLAQQALDRKLTLEQQIAHLTRQRQVLGDDERKLNAALQQLEARIAALREGRPWHPSPLRLSSDVPKGERNSRVIPQDVKIAVSARDGGRCRRCGSTEELHFDHVIPWSKGGANTVNNIQLLCGPCNRRKGADDISARW
jgi:hypothetical protein